MGIFKNLFSCAFTTQKEDDDITKKEFVKVWRVINNAIRYGENTFNQLNEAKTDIRELQKEIIRQMDIMRLKIDNLEIKIKNDIDLINLKLTMNDKKT